MHRWRRRWSRGKPALMILVIPHSRLRPHSIVVSWVLGVHFFLKLRLLKSLSISKLPEPSNWKELCVRANKSSVASNKKKHRTLVFIWLMTSHRHPPLWHRRIFSYDVTDAFTGVPCFYHRFFFVYFQNSLIHFCVLFISYL